MLENPAISPWMSLLLLDFRLAADF